jgi:hypothetical protein
MAAKISEIYTVSGGGLKIKNKTKQNKTKQTKPNQTKTAKRNKPIISFHSPCRQMCAVILHFLRFCIPTNEVSSEQFNMSGFLHFLTEK